MQGSVASVKSKSFLKRKNKNHIFESMYRELFLSPDDLQIIFCLLWRDTYQPFHMDSLTLLSGQERPLSALDIINLGDHMYIRIKQLSHWVSVNEWTPEQITEGPSKKRKIRREKNAVVCSICFNFHRGNTGFCLFICDEQERRSDWK